MLLLYSGGLDTSVMLRWIQERYDAEMQRTQAFIARLQALELLTRRLMK